jgi:hypothetical protein
MSNGDKSLIKDITTLCESLTLIEADIALDDARRYLWLKQFSGASDAALKERLKNPHMDIAMQIADRLEGISPLEAESIFLEARCSIWMAEFAAIPESIFARQLHAHNERSQDRVTLQ